MLLTCISVPDIYMGALTIGKEYNIYTRYGCLLFELDNGIETTMPPYAFECAIRRFESKIKTASKFILQKPGGTPPRTMVDLLVTEKYFIVYSHTKGTHWNISGNHHRYFHDINTGEFICGDPPFNKNDVLLKQQITVKDYNRLIKHFKKAS